MFTNVLLLSFVHSTFSSCSQSRTDVSAYVDDFLLHAKTFITNKGLTTLDLPDAANERWFAKSFLSSGTVRDLASIRRLGNATMASCSQGSVTRYDIDTTAGLDSLLVEYKYRFQFLWAFRSSGHLAVRTKRNSLQANSMVIVDSNSGLCYLTVNHAAVEYLEDFDIEIQQAGFWKFIVQMFVKSVLNYLVPNFISVINSELYDLFRNYPVNQNLTQYVCHYFHTEQ